ncbi:MAG: helix-turn-helix transcriptional regulator [Dehalococcoidia bacterium]|nr:helix-turn-helix transcriptional regulator [Dehalococcoidia bacterium]
MASNVLGDYLRDLRNKRRLSLREVGEKVGVSGSYLSQIETSERHPSAEILRKLAPAYGVPVRDLLEVAGFLDEPEAVMSDAEHLEWAFQCVLSDPEYKFGNRLRGADLAPDAKRFIIEVYEKATGRKLL